MAPERFRGEAITAASDLYSLGVVLFELLTNRPLFEASSLSGYLVQHLEQVPVSVRTYQPACPEGLANLVAEMLAKRPVERPADAHIVERRLTPFTSKQGRVLRHASVQSLGDVHRHDGQRRAGGQRGADLEAWGRRVSVYRQMLNTGWPQGAPVNLVQRVNALDQTVNELLRARDGDVQLLDRLESLDDDLRTRREQLGRAISTLAADLSEARASFRQRCPFPEQWREAIDQAEALQLENPHVPQAEILASMRSATAAYGEWLRAWEDTPIKDLMFQIERLREQQADAETSARRKQSEVAADATHRNLARTATEASLLRISHELNTQLRPIAALRSLFERLS
jgi:hypothetical protein